MTLENIIEQAKNLTYKDFDKLVAWVVTDGREHHNQRKANETAEVTIIENLIATGAVEGAKAVTYEQALTLNQTDIPSWRNPGTDRTKMHLPKAVVKRGGRTWLNIATDHLNATEPGNSDEWQDVTDLIEQQKTRDQENPEK